MEDDDDLSDDALSDDALYEYLTRTRESFGHFQGGVGAKVFRKLTGKDPAKIEGWWQLKAALVQWGRSSDPKLRKIEREGLNAVAFFSGGEELVAIAMLHAANHGHLADKAAEKVGWFSSINRSADESTLAVVGKLTLMRI